MRGFSFISVSMARHVVIGRRKYKGPVVKRGMAGDSSRECTPSLTSILCQLCMLILINLND